MKRIGLTVLMATSLISSGCGHADATVTEDSRAVAFTTGVTDASTSDRLDVEIYQAESPDAMSNDRRVDVPFEITFTNRSQETITLGRLYLQSMGEGLYRITRRTRTYDEVIEPGDEATLTFWASATVMSGRSTDRPLTVRLIAEYESGSELIEDTFVQQVNGRVSLGGSVDQ